MALPGEGDGVLGSWGSRFVRRRGSLVDKVLGVRDQGVKVVLDLTRRKFRLALVGGLGRGLVGDQFTSQ